MRFLVTRADAIHDERIQGNLIRNSDIWPYVVEADTHEDAVRKVYENNFGSEQKLPLGRLFIVVALIDAQFVSFRPKQDYTITTQPYF